MSGDATISNTGVVTLATNAVEQANIADDAVGTAELDTIPICSLSKDTTIVMGAATAVTFLTSDELTDLSAMHSNGSARITIGETGIYRIRASTVITEQPVGRRC